MAFLERDREMVVSVFGRVEAHTGRLLWGDEKSNGASSIPGCLRPGLRDQLLRKRVGRFARSSLGRSGARSVA